MKERGERARTRGARRGREIDPTTFLPTRPSGVVPGMTATGGGRIERRNAKGENVLARSTFECVSASRCAPRERVERDRGQFPIVGGPWLPAKFYLRCAPPSTSSPHRSSRGGRIVVGSSRGARRGPGAMAWTAAPDPVRGVGGPAASTSSASDGADFGALVGALEISWLLSSPPTSRTRRRCANRR